MRDSLNIKIKKRTGPEWLTLFVVFMPFLLSFLIDFIGLPSFVKYLIDVAWVSLLFIMAVRMRVVMKREQLAFIWFMAIWLVYVCVMYIFNFQSPFYFLWGIRNNFRFYVAFAAFLFFMEEDDATRILDIFDYIFWINIPVVLFQFAILGYRQDYLGGIFGVEKGCNAYTSILFVVVVAKSILLYVDGKEKSCLCLTKCAIALIIAAMAELKFFLILFVVIVLLIMLFSKLSWKKVALFLGMSILVFIAGNLLTAIFGEHEQLNLARILELVMAENYATAEDLGRFTAIPTISENIFTNWTERLFGLGLGNCDTSAFAICNTPFYQMHEHMHYSWFSSAFLFLETGYVGLLLNLSFFVLCFVRAFSQFKKEKGNQLFNRLVMIAAILCVIYTFYNSSLRKECGLLMYFILALPFININNGKEGRVLEYDRSAKS